MHFTDNWALSDAPHLPTLDDRAAEAARLARHTLFPELSDQEVPVVYHKVARIILQAVEEGLV